MRYSVKVFGAALGIALGGVLSAFGAVPTLSSPANGAELATLKGTTTEEGSHKWYFCGLTPAMRKSVMNYEAYYGTYAQNSAKYNALRAKMGNSYGDRPKATTFSWSGTGPFTLTIKRRDGSVFLEKSGIAGTSLAVDNFEIAASYTWTVSNADGASAPRSFTTEDTVPRLLNGARPDMVCTVEGYGGTSISTLYPHGVRDMGGYIGKDGRRGRQGLLIRNSALESDYDEDGGKTPYVNESNIGFWNDFIGVKYEIDLRNNGESQLTKSTLGSQVKYLRIDSISTSKTLIESNVSGFRSGVKKFFQVLVNPDNYPVTFHCTHGKDRTGLVGFLIGCVLGYSVDDIYMDYEATAFWQPKQPMGLDNGNGIVDYLNAHYSDATLQAKAVHLIKDSGITETQLNTMREFLLEPLPTDDVPEQSATFTVNGYKGASTLENYPVLVRLSKGALANGATATFTEDGADLRAYDASGNEIPHEIETWDPSGESTVWVRLPKLYGAISGQKTTFTLTWGGEPAARTTTDRDVWAGDYGIVLHGGLDASNNLIDAVTGNAAIAVGGTHSEVTSGTKVGRALTFDNTSSQATIPASCFASATDYKNTWLPLWVNKYNTGVDADYRAKWPFTISGWYNLSSYTSGSATLLRIPINSSKNAVAVKVTGDKALTIAGYSGYNDTVSYSKSYPLDTSVKGGWVHLAISFWDDGQHVRIAVNGVPQRGHYTGDISDTADGQPFYFAEKMKGQMDELRISRQTQTPDRLLAEYETMADPSFCTGVYGTPAASVTAPTITAPANGAVMPLQTSIMKELLGYDAATYADAFSDDDFRSAAACPEPYNSQPALTYLEWSGSSPSWEVHLYDVTDVETEVTLFANVVTANRLALGWLQSGRSYRWTVKSANGQTAEGTFSTEAGAPRPIYVSGKIANCRDMGGWTGLDGRKIRQGLAYRSSGFDDGASSKTSLADADSKRILVDVLGVKTDIDTRGKTTGASPLGSGIKVVSQSLESYGGWDKAGYPERFVTVFKTYLDQTNYPIILHCQDGQDRTGCAQFILGGLLGMSDDDLMRDYMWSCLWRNDFNAGNKKMPGFLAIINTYSGATYAEKSYSWATAHGITPAQIETFRSIMLEPAEQPIEHTHVWSDWTTNPAPTCVTAGTRTHTCTAEGCTTPAATESEEVPKLGHVWVTVPGTPATTTSTGLTDGIRCSRCLEWQVTQKVIPILQPEPSARTVTAGEVKDGKMTLSFGAGSSDLLLFAVWGATDVGDAFHLNVDENGWQNFAFVARIPAATTSYEYTLPSGWGTTVKYVRFFMTAVDEAPVASLVSVSGTDGAAVLDTGYVPTTATPTIAAFVKTPAGTRNQKIFEVGTEGANDPYLVCDMYVNADGKPAFNCRNSSKTSGWGCNDEVNSAVLESAEAMRWQVACGTPQGRYDGTKDNGTNPDDVPTAPANGTVKFYGVGEITQATVMESTYVHYLKPAMVYDAAGELVAGFYDSITHKAFASATETPFTAGDAASYARDLLNGVTYYGDSGTIEYVAPPPPPEEHDYDTLYRTLQTDGLGYILTDYVPANLKTVKVEIKARKLNTLVGFYYMANANTAALAKRSSPNGNELGLGFWASAQFDDGMAPGLQYYCEPGTVIFKRGFCDTVWAHTFVTEGADVTVDGETCTTGKTPKNESAGGPIALFCCSMNGSTAHHVASLRVQYVRVWDGDTLVRDWVPATKNGVATLYDKVHDRCETVLGGTFTADDELDPDYADKPVNAWVREPSLTASYAAGTAPTFDIGEARYGSPVATYTAAQLAMLDGGVYTQVVKVAETDEYRELAKTVVFTVTGMLPREASVAPAVVWPNGDTVLTHTSLQREYLVKSDAERRNVYEDAVYRQTLANGKSGPLPTALKWTGDGLTTVTVTRVTGTEKLFLQREIVSVKGAENVLEIENLEIATTYRWTVENALGTATGTFTTDAEAPRLLRDPGPDQIRGIRDLGGRPGLDGKRVRQGLVFRSSQLGRDTDAVNFINDVNRGFWTDFLGIRTELDFRGGSENAGVTKSPIGDGVNYYKWSEPTASYGFDSYDSYRKSFVLFLDRNNYPIDFHCAAGQDRTGVFAFLLNALLGVSEDELQKDWEVTAFWNSSVGFRFENYDRFRANLAAAGGANAREQAENYVINELKFTMDDINTFRGIMLEEVVAPSVIEIVPPALSATEVVWNGSEQRPTVPENDAYSVDYGAGDYTAVGDYMVTVTLKDKVNTAWTGGSTDDLALKYRIKPKSVDPVFPDKVTTNEMDNASWGYKITGLGDDHRDVALVFTNAADKTMNWTVPQNVTSFEFLVVGGGGGGAGCTSGGGGGAGGMVTGALARVTASSRFSVAVGAGGTGGAYNGVGTSGEPSSISLGEGEEIVADGGGKAGRNGAGTAGGSGGGAGCSSSNVIKGGSATKGSVSGFDGVIVYEAFGNSGGTNVVKGANAGAGGGGAGAAGGDVLTNKIPGNGGNGLVCGITGLPVVYAGGGGGGSNTGTQNGNGGAGGGGNGGRSNRSPTSGTSGLGGGGGAGGANSGTYWPGRAGNGGSGVVIIRYTAPQGEDPEPKEGWPEDPSKDGGKAASDKYPQIPADSVLGSVDAGTLGKWAKAKSVDFAEFMADPDSFEKAFLLDCAVSEVEVKEVEFRFTEIVPGVQPTIGEESEDKEGLWLYGNGKVVVYGVTELSEDQDWKPADGDSRFFKAKLVPLRYDENQ